LDEEAFSILVNAMNTPTFMPTSSTVLPLLEASLVWSAPIFIDASLAFLTSTMDRPLVIAAVQLSASADVTFEGLESAVASALADFVRDTEFAALPVYLLSRILTWYDAPLPPLAGFVVNAFRASGRPWRDAAGDQGSGQFWGGNDR
jgi:hypothetical protein